MDHLLLDLMFPHQFELRLPNNPSLVAALPDTKDRGIPYEKL